MKRTNTSTTDLEKALEAATLEAKILAKAAKKAKAAEKAKRAEAEATRVQLRAIGKKASKARFFADRTAEADIAALEVELPEAKAEIKKAEAEAEKAAEKAEAAEAEADKTRQYLDNAQHKADKAAEKAAEAKASEADKARAEKAAEVLGEVIKQAEAAEKAEAEAFANSKLAETAIILAQAKAHTIDTTIKLADKAEELAEKADKFTAEAEAKAAELRAAEAEAEKLHTATKQAVRQAAKAKAAAKKAAEAFYEAKTGEGPDITKAFTAKDKDEAKKAEAAIIAKYEAEAEAKADKARAKGKGYTITTRPYTVKLRTRGPVNDQTEFHNLVIRTCHNGNEAKERAIAIMTVHAKKAYRQLLSKASFVTERTGYIPNSVANRQTMAEAVKSAYMVTEVKAIDSTTKRRKISANPSNDNNGKAVTLSNGKAYKVGQVRTSYTTKAAEQAARAAEALAIAEA